MIDGVLNLNKPAGISSAAAVSRVKRLLPRGTKIGHAGTLDPFASGVLLLLIGRATKLCERLMDSPKAYAATIKFGATTVTDDPESPEQATAGASPVAVEIIDAALPRFTGAITQAPPAFSALKVGGFRSYQLARAGETVALQPRTVHVYRITRQAYDWPELQLNVECGRGTYIRALARDLGAHLGVGGYLTALCRTRVGRFELNAAVSLSDLSTDRLEASLVPLSDAVQSPITDAPPTSRTDRREW